MHKGIYQHYKGNYYVVIDIARHSETLEDMAIGIVTVILAYGCGR